MMIKLKHYFQFVVLMAVAAALAVVLGTDAAVAAAANETANVIISQVIYDPIASESGGEAVELYNPTASSINASGWVIATETSPTDATLPQGAIICSGCYYLIADANWSNAKDNSSWPNADFEEAITLANTDAGVALKDSSGVIVDAVGWGNSAGIAAGLFESVPHGGSSSGKSLLRKTTNGSYLDTNNNSNDFVEATPNFRNSSSTPQQISGSSSEIQVTIVVSGSGPAVNSLSVLTDDDSFLPGSQVSPVPQKKKTVNVEAVVSDDNGIADIASVVLSFNSSAIAMVKKSEINSTAAAYSVAFNLSSSFPAGNYSITVTATDSSGFSANLSAQFEYLSLIAVDVDASSIVFYASPGSTYEVVGDNSTATATNVTLLNSGNVQLDFDVWATNFSAGTGLVEASRLQYTFNGNYSDAAFGGNMTNTKARKDVNINPGFMRGLSLKLNLPLATTPGNYSGTISLVAVNSG